MKTVKKYRFITAFIVAMTFVALLYSSSVNALTVREAQLNQLLSVSTPSVPMTAANTPQKLWKNITNKGYTPYISLFRYRVEIGSRYTFQVEYPGDKLHGSAILRGENPLTDYTYSYGPLPKGISISRLFPGGNISKCIFAHRTNFSISSKSEHNTLWLIVASKNPNTPFKILLKSPADPDNEVRYNKRARCPGESASFTWGGIQMKPVWLGYDPDEKKQGLTPPVAATADLNGTWDIFDDKGKSIASFNLKQHGSSVNGMYIYEHGQAIVQGVIHGDQLKLEVIYNNEKVLNQWLSPAISRQVIGIKARFDIKLRPGAKELKGTFYSFWVSWNGNKVTGKYSGGSANAMSHTKPKARILRRTEPLAHPVTIPKGGSQMVQHETLLATGGVCQIAQQIRNGAQFVVTFDMTAEKFNDGNYTGDYRTDPMGTLKGGESYHLFYRSGQFTCKGYSQQAKSVISHTDGGANPDDGLISLWGRGYAFDGKGQVYDRDYGLVGHLKITR